jgi:hypothetical protein
MEWLDDAMPTPYWVRKQREREEGEQGGAGEGQQVAAAGAR